MFKWIVENVLRPIAVAMVQAIAPVIAEIAAKWLSVLFAPPATA